MIYLLQLVPLLFYLITEPNVSTRKWLNNPIFLLWQGHFECVSVNSYNRR